MIVHAIYAWLKKASSCYILMELLCQLTPGKEYRKYLRFFCSIIMIVMLIRPILYVLQVDIEVEERLKSIVAQQKAEEMKELCSSLQGLQSRKMMTMYKQELYKQIQEIATAAKERCIQVNVLFETEKEIPKLKKIDIVLAKRTDRTDRTDGVIEELKKQIGEIYGLSECAVTISRKE